MSVRVARLRDIIVVLVAALVGASARVEAQAALLDGFGGPAGFGSDVVPIGDDLEATVTVDVSTAFPAGLDFYGTRVSSIHVNTNGNITFRSRFGTFTPSAFPGAPQPVIAPWWADGDTRGVVEEPEGANRVYYVVEPGRVVVTWYLLGYFGAHADLLNSFQLVLTPPREPRADDPPDAFDVEFRYARCEWTTGDASGGRDGVGGRPALAGLDAGDGENFVTLPGSLSMDVLRLCVESNVGERGVWRFSPRGTRIEATCGNGYRETGELCDDGNTRDGDGCSAHCTIELPPECGNGRREFGEECDDGNTRSGDGCDARCLLELGPCDPIPTTRDASALTDASCVDAGPPPPPDAGREIPILEGDGCACALGRRAAGPRAGLFGLGLALGLGVVSRIARRRARSRRSA